MGTCGGVFYGTTPWVKKQDTKFLAITSTITLFSNFFSLADSVVNLQLLKNGDFLNTDISQGSVATRLGCDGVFVNIFVTNFLLSLTVKEFWKSDNIWWSYGQELGVLCFFWLTVYDEKATDQRLQDPVKRFKVNVFNASSG